MTGASRSGSGGKALLNAVLDLLFPPKCPFCRELLKREERYFCARCDRRGLPWTEGEERKSVQFVLHCISPLWYDGRVRKAVHRYKFSGVTAYAPAFGGIMAREVRKTIESGVNADWDVITWVPLSKKSLRRRGYDQAYLLAEEMGRELGVKPVPALRKVLETKVQSTLKTSAERRANVLGAYQVSHPENIAGKRVLLVDDVVTSGASLAQCALMLRAAGAQEVVAVTLARAGE